MRGGALEHGWYLTIAGRLSRLPRGWTGDSARATLRGDDETGIPPRAWRKTAR